METVNHLEDSLERISTDTFYIPHSMNTCTQTCIHTHVHTLIVIIFPPVLTRMRIYNCFKKVTNSTSEIPHFTELHYYSTSVRQPNTMSALQLIYSNICKNIWGGGKLMSTFNSSVPKKLMVVGDSQAENTEINSTFERLCAQSYKKEGKNTPK